MDSVVNKTAFLILDKGFYTRPRWIKPPYKKLCFDVKNIEMQSFNWFFVIIVMLGLWFNDWLNKHSIIEHLMCLTGKLFEWVRLWYDLLPDPNEINQMIEVH